MTVDRPANLPLTRPLRLIPGGDILADALDPTMTELVNAGYNDGKGTEDNPAIPKDPTVTTADEAGLVADGLGRRAERTVQRRAATAGATTAIEDIANPANFVTKPLGEVGKLPGISSLTDLVAEPRQLPRRRRAKKRALDANKTGYVVIDRAVRGR